MKLSSAPGVQDFYSEIYGNDEGVGGTKILAILNAAGNNAEGLRRQAGHLADEGITAFEILNRGNTLKNEMGTADLLHVVNGLSNENKRIIVGTVMTMTQLQRVLESTAVGFATPANRPEFAEEAICQSGGAKLSFVTTDNPSTVQSHIMTGFGRMNGNHEVRPEYLPPELLTYKLSPAEKYRDFPLQSEARNAGGPRASFAFTSPAMNMALARELCHGHGSVEQKTGMAVRMAIAVVVGDDLTELKALKGVIGASPLESKWKN